MVFSNFAVASSFLGVTLGLFDYPADLFGFDDSAMGRFKTALLTFIPPMIGGLVKPDGFLYAIGYAWPAATIWAAVPALRSRKRFGSPQFRVWGGTPMIVLILLFGLGMCTYPVERQSAAVYRVKLLPGGATSTGLTCVTPTAPLSPASLNRKNADAPGGRRSGH